MAHTDTMSGREMCNLDGDGGLMEVEHEDVTLEALASPTHPTLARAVRKKGGESARLRKMAAEGASLILS